jgi:hypothetical protein
MKKLTDYIAESESPVARDTFAINIREECLIESHVVDVVEDGIVIEGDERLLALLEEYGFQLETIRRYGAVGSSHGMGYTLGEEGVAEGNNSSLDGILARHADAVEEFKNGGEMGYDLESDLWDYYFSRGDIRNYNADASEWLAQQLAGELGLNEQAVAEDELGRILKLAEVSPEDPAPVPPSQPNPDANRNDPLAAKAADDAAVGPMEEDGVDPVNAQGQDAEDLQGQATSSISATVDEAEYRGREVKLGKPMAGDVKKSKVYVRGPKGNVVKVNFGDPNMRIKKSNPARRKSFRARHNCDNPGPRWKARYWSCRAW